MVFMDAMFPLLWFPSPRIEAMFLCRGVVAALVPFIPSTAGKADSVLGFGVGIMDQTATLWWTNILPWKDPPFFMGKSTISTGPFSIANC